jgi:hypothetical protein
MGDSEPRDDLPGGWPAAERSDAFGNGIGDEDVLVGDEPLLPYARTKFRRKRDVLAVVVIAVIALVAALLMWQSSDARNTSSQPYDGPVPTQEPPTRFPASLGESWRARSSATPVPVAVGETIVTGEGGEVAGRDPFTGEVRWRYTRDLPLCTVSTSWQMALAVYQKSDNLLPAGDSRKGGGCSEFTALDPGSGRRGRQPSPTEERAKPDGGQRNSDAELGTRLLSDGTYVTTTGERLLTTVRSDLVRTVEYGELPAIVNPDKQPRTGCTYGTMAVEAGRIAVIERCPDDPSERLTVYNATHDDNDDDKPVVVSSVVVGEGAQVVGMSEHCRVARDGEETAVELCTAVVLPNPARLVVYDQTGTQIAQHEVDLGAGDLRTEPADHTVATNRTTGAIYWFTGSRTIALSEVDLSPLWTVEDALGPGTAFAGKIVIPVTDGLAVIQPTDGERIGTIPVDRGDYTGLVTTSALGSMVYEQRGDTLVALN